MNHFHNNLNNLPNEEQKEQIDILVTIMAIGLSLPVILMVIVTQVNFFNLQELIPQLELFVIPNASIFSLFIIAFLSIIPLITLLVLDDIRVAKHIYPKGGQLDDR